MKKSRFSDSQILAIPKQAESGTPVANLCREHGISNACFYQGRSKFGGMNERPNKANGGLPPKQMLTTA